MPPVIYECSVEGTCDDQTIVNVLYYAKLTAADNGWSTTRAQQLGEAVRDAWQNSAMIHLPNQYVFQGVTVRGLNLDRTPASTYPIEVAGSGSGAATDPTKTNGMVGIVSFRLSAAPEYESERVPRRSYIAFGPLVQLLISEQGVINWDTTFRNNLTAVLTQGHLLASGQMSPVRLGTPNSLGVPAIGQVDGVTFRPFASFRRSRLNSPSGG